MQPNIKTLIIVGGVNPGHLLQANITHCQNVKVPLLFCPSTVFLPIMQHCSNPRTTQWHQTNLSLEYFCMVLSLVKYVECDVQQQCKLAGQVWFCYSSKLHSKRTILSVQHFFLVLIIDHFQIGIIFCGVLSLGNSYNVFIRSLSTTESLM